MPSPFPGMNPYLEHPRVWQGFHNQFVPAISQSLNARLGESYIALVEEQVYIHETDGNGVRLAGRADVGLTRHDAVELPHGAAVLTAPVRVIVPAAGAEALSHVEIRTRDGRELVTVLEVLSPTNKRSGWHREQYLTKRALVLNSDAHLVEVDLLRGWERMPFEAAVTSDYRVLVSRAEARPDAGLWPIGLRDPLPKIPVPLGGSDPDVQIDLQNLLHQVYDAAAYRKLIYEHGPVPPLPAADAAWAAAVADGAGIA